MVMTATKQKVIQKAASFLKLPEAERDRVIYLSGVNDCADMCVRLMVSELEQVIPQDSQPLQRLRELVNDIREEK